MENKVNRFIKIYPWFSGLTADLLFYIAIDTLFLTVVKNLSAAQIVSLTSVATIVCIAVQFPILWIIQRIGNTASVKIGALFMLLSAILIAFGPNYYFILAGKLFHDIANIFRSAIFVALENNLELIDRRQDFIKMRTRANTVYAVLTMLISFVASMMFNWNNYLPMIGCLITCTAGFVLSLFMTDYSGYNKIPRKKNGERVKIKFNKLIILAIVTYGLFYPIITLGQSEGKLFIQQHLLLDFNVDNTSLIIGAILCVSRVIRVASNLAFTHIYRKLQAKVGVLLPSLLGMSIALLILGSFVPQVVVKTVVMGVGYVIILFLRDPFRLYMQDVLFANTAKEYHQTLLTILEFSVRIGTAGISMIFTLLLLKYPMIVVMFTMLAFAVAEIIMSIWLYRYLLTAKQAKQTGGAIA